MIKNIFSQIDDRSNDDFNHDHSKCTNNLLNTKKKNEFFYISKLILFFCLRKFLCINFFSKIYFRKNIITNSIDLLCLTN